MLRILLMRRFRIVSIMCRAYDLFPCSTLERVGCHSICNDLIMSSATESGDKNIHWRCYIHGLFYSTLVDCVNGSADIVFVVDKSTSITDFGFEIYKQLVSDVVSMLPVDGNVRVAMVSFSGQASTVFEFTNDPSHEAIFGEKFAGNSSRLAQYGQTCFFCIVAAPTI